MCLVMQINTHIAGNNLIPISYTCIYLEVSSGQEFRSFLVPIEGEGRDEHRDQIITCDVGVSLHSKTHPLFMKYSNVTSTQCYTCQYI